MAPPHGRAGGRPAKPLAPPKSTSRTALTVIVRQPPRIPTEVYDSYWRFAAERQSIFFRRFSGGSQPWTDDPVLGTYKFTNAYRASDRVSQYLIRRVIYRPDLPSTDAEVCFRILLFKMFNKIDTWELFEAAFGAVTYEEYRFESYDKVLTTAMQAGRRIYSAAYIMPPGEKTFGHSAKHQNNLLLLESIMQDDFPTRLVDSPTMRHGFELLRSYPGLGDFLAYQFITDINYSELTDFSEGEFVMPGPGALDGIHKCFADLGGLEEAEVIRLAAEAQESEFRRLGLEFETLWGRRLQLIDCQNLFCEISKYARVAHPHIGGTAGRTRIKQKYKAGGPPIDYWYPPKWGINERITCEPPVCTPC